MIIFLVVYLVIGWYAIKKLPERNPEMCSSPWYDFAICLFYGMFGVHKLQEGKPVMCALYIFTFGLFCIGWVYDSVRYLMGAMKGERIISPTLLTKPAVRELGENDQLPVVLGHGILLKSGEVCHYYAEATSVKVKTAVTGYSGGSSGVSMRIAKGVSYRTGQRNATPIRETIQERHPGWLAITNDRIVFTSSQESFDKKVEKLSSMNLLDDGVVLQFGERQHIIETKEPKYIQQIISRVYQSVGVQ